MTTATKDDKADELVRFFRSAMIHNVNTLCSPGSSWSQQKDALTSLEGELRAIRSVFKTRLEE